MSHLYSRSPSYGASERQETPPLPCVAGEEQVLGCEHSGGVSVTLGSGASSPLLSHAACAANFESTCTAGTSQPGKWLANSISCKLLFGGQLKKQIIRTDSTPASKMHFEVEDLLMEAAPASRHSSPSISSTGACMLDSPSVNQTSVLYHSFPCSCSESHHSYSISTPTRMQLYLHRPLRYVSSPRNAESPHASHAEYASIEMTVDDTNEIRSFYSCSSDSKVPCDAGTPQQRGDLIDGAEVHDRIYAEAHQQLERAISLLSSGSQLISVVGSPWNASDSAALGTPASDATDRRNPKRPTSHDQLHRVLPHDSANGSTDESPMLRRTQSSAVLYKAEHLDAPGVPLLSRRAVSVVCSRGSRRNRYQTSVLHDAVRGHLEGVLPHSTRDEEFPPRSAHPVTSDFPLLPMHQPTLQQEIHYSNCHKLSGFESRGKRAEQRGFDATSDALHKASSFSGVAFNRGRNSISDNVNNCPKSNQILRLHFRGEKCCIGASGVQWATLPAGVPFTEERPQTTEPEVSKIIHRRTAHYSTGETAIRSSKSAHPALSKNVSDFVYSTRTTSLIVNSSSSVKSLTVSHRSSQKDRIFLTRSSSEPASACNCPTSRSITKSGLPSPQGAKHDSVSPTPASPESEKVLNQVAKSFAAAQQPIHSNQVDEEGEARYSPSPVLIDGFAESVKGCINKLIARFPSGTQLHNGYGGLKVPALWTEVPEGSDLTDSMYHAGENIGSPVKYPNGNFTEKLKSLSEPDQKLMLEAAREKAQHFSEEDVIFRLELETTSASEASCYYSVEDTLGRGAHGAVFLARRFVRSSSSSASDEVDMEEDVVAIKVVDLDAALRTQCVDAASRLRYLEQMVSEMQILPMLTHENIVRFYEAFQWPPCYAVIVTEYLPGGSLKDLYVQCGPLPEPVIAPLLQDVTRALAYLHSDEKKIVHRDVKAANILLTEGGQAKLVDFGISTNFTGCLKEFVGTPPWMAPEVASLFWSAHPVAPRISATENEAAKSQHEHAADPPSGYSYEADIWSLGITAYEVATGKLPWPSRFKVRELMERISRGPPPRINISDGYEKTFCFFVERCLRKIPIDRGTASELLTHAFFQKFCSGKRFHSIQELREAVEIFNGKRKASLIGSVIRALPFLSRKEQQKPKRCGKRKVQADTLQNWGRNSGTLKSVNVSAKAPLSSRSLSGIFDNQSSAATLPVNRHYSGFSLLHTQANNTNSKPTESRTRESSRIRPAKSSNPPTETPSLSPFEWPVVDSEGSKSQDHPTETFNNLENDMEQPFVPSDDYLGMEGAALIDRRKVSDCATREIETCNETGSKHLQQQSSQSLLSSFLSVFMRNSSLVENEEKEEKQSTLPCSALPELKEMEVNGNMVLEDGNLDTKSVTCSALVLTMPDSTSCIDDGGTCISKNEADGKVGRCVQLSADSLCTSTSLAPKPFRKTRQNKDREKQGKVGKEAKMFANSGAEGFLGFLRRIGFPGTSQVEPVTLVESGPFPIVTPAGQENTTPLSVCMKEESEYGKRVDGGCASSTGKGEQEPSVVCLEGKTNKVHLETILTSGNAKACHGDLKSAPDTSGVLAPFTPCTTDIGLTEETNLHNYNPLRIADTAGPADHTDVNNIHSGEASGVFWGEGLHEESHVDKSYFHNGASGRFERCSRCNSEESSRTKAPTDQWRHKQKQHSEADISALLQSTDIDAVKQYIKLTAGGNARKLFEGTANASSIVVRDRSKTPAISRLPSSPEALIPTLTHEMCQTSKMHGGHNVSLQNNERLQAVRQEVCVQVPLYQRFLDGISALVEHPGKPEDGSYCEQEASNADVVRVTASEGDVYPSPGTDIHIQQSLAKQVSDKAAYQAKSEDSTSAVQPLVCDEGVGRSGWFWALWGKETSGEAPRLASETTKMEVQGSVREQDMNDLERNSAAYGTGRAEGQPCLSNECAPGQSSFFDSHEHHPVVCGILQKTYSAEHHLVGVQCLDFAYQRYASFPINQLHSSPVVSSVAERAGELVYHRDVPSLGFKSPSRVNVAYTPGEVPIERVSAVPTFPSLVDRTYLVAAPPWNKEADICRPDVQSNCLSQDSSYYWRQTDGVSRRRISVHSLSNTVGIPHGYSQTRPAFGLQGLSCTPYLENQTAERNNGEAQAVPRESIYLADLLQLEKFSHSPPNG